MNELRDMHSRTNSLEVIKEKYKKAIIDNFTERLSTLSNKGKVSNSYIEGLRSLFDDILYDIAFDDSLGFNDSRWGIVSKKNFFGLDAEIFPIGEERKKEDYRLFLKVCSGRFPFKEFSKFKRLFPNSINISDILGRSENEQFTELEEFYNMNNREVFERFGITACCSIENGGEANLIANCVLLDSLLQGRYSEMQDVFCDSPQGYVIKIKLEDGTEISANSTELMANSETGKKGITIRKDGKEASVDFDAISMGDNTDILTNINELEVENVVYTGEPELIAQLQQAMQEQFKSQRERDEEETQSDGTSELQEEQQIEEQIGAQKIIEFMNQNNLGAHDLSLALSMVLARTTDKTKAEQHIIGVVDKDREDSESIQSEH